jgi:hypothetical protein
MEIKIKAEHEKEIENKLEYFIINKTIKFKPSKTLLDSQKKFEKAVKQKEYIKNIINININFILR